MEKKYKIMIVDDEKLIRWSITKALEVDNWDVSSAESAEDAMDLTNENVFDAVITDLRLPGIDGIELLKKIKQKTPECPVILISAYGTQEVISKAKEFGACNFLNKPISLNLIRDAAKKCLNN